MECKYVAVDIGGTFTDLVAYSPDSKELMRAKVLTTPHDPSDGFMGSIDVARLTLGKTGFVKHGTTLAINTVIERTGARTALITTKGFRDVLEVARGNRPTPFNLHFRRMPPLVPRDMRLEVSARMSGSGTEISPVVEAELEALLVQLKALQPEAIAIALLNSYCNPAHEMAIGAWLRERLDIYVTESSQLTREWREYERTSTAVINAYVGPRLSGYIGKLDERLRAAGFPGAFFMMESNGGIMSAESAISAPVKVLESGPVAGVVGVAKVCEEIGVDKGISFDMGGTTAKCALVTKGQISTVNTYYLGGYESGYPVLAPVVDIVEVGAGGGSIAWIDPLGALNVGPRSAGAAPGPICYRLGGTEPTITDANAILGRLPVVGTIGGPRGLDVDGAITALGKKICEPLGLGVDEAAYGIIRLGITIMASSVRRITVERGLDPREFTLVMTGGAGPLHAIEIARELGMDKVIIPAGPGHFSAWGMLLADIRHEYAVTLNRGLNDLDLGTLEARYVAMEEDAQADLGRDRDNLSGSRMSRFADMRFQGQEHTVRTPVDVDLSLPDARERIKASFLNSYEQRFGRGSLSAAPERVILRVVAEGLVDKPGFPSIAVAHTHIDKVNHKAYFSGHGWVATPILDRGALREGDQLAGPALIVEEGSTTVLPPGATVVVDRIGNLLCTPGH